MLNVRRISGVTGLNHLLQGGIVGGTDFGNRRSSLYLNGLTLIFTSPVSETVTFSSSGDQVPLTMAAVISQIEAQTTGIVAKMIYQQLWLVEASPSSGVALDDGGTANGKLGFSTTTATAGIVYATPGSAAPALVSITPTPDNAFILTTDET